MATADTGTVLLFAVLTVTVCLNDSAPDGEATAIAVTTSSDSSTTAIGVCIDFAAIDSEMTSPSAIMIGMGKMRCLHITSTTNTSTK